jgi:hypothetical protein
VEVNTKHILVIHITLSYQHLVVLGSFDLILSVFSGWRKPRYSIYLNLVSDVAASS